MANFINKYQNSTAYDADSTKQFPNVSLVGNGVVYTRTQPAFGGLTVTYYIEDPSIEIPLFNGGGGSGESESESESGSGGVMPATMVVDGVSETPVNSWRFETAGNHIVQYTFTDNNIPQEFLLNKVYAREVTVGTDIIGMGSAAFAIELITSVTVEATTPPTLSDATVFGSGTVNYPIYVPSASVSTYQAAQFWSSYSSRIQAIV